jgi:tetratricopeptide (TPR) repeat protein
MDKNAILAFSKGADINTDDGAELEFSAPKNLRRPTTVLNQRIMAPYLIDSPPWLKMDALPVPEALHHYYMAESYVASISYDRALRSLEKAIELDPKNPRFYLLQAKIYLEQDKSSEAAKAAFKAMERDPDTANEVLSMSDEFYLPDAKVVYSKVIEMGSKEVLPYLGLGNIALHAGDLKEAEKWFARARDLQPEHPAVLLAWGRFQAAQAGREKDPAIARKQWREAKDLLEKSKATELEKSATLYSAMGEVYEKLDMWPEAADSYREALRMRRRRNDWRMALGQAYAKLGRVGEAKQKYCEVLALSPDDSSAWQSLESIGKRYSDC